MARRLSLILFFGVLVSLSAKDASGFLLANNLFDEPDTNQDEPKIKKEPAKDAVEPKTKKDAVVKKKRRRKKGTLSKNKESALSQKSTKTRISASTWARESYEWAPESEPLQLRSRSAGMKPAILLPSQLAKPVQAATPVQPADSGMATTKKSWLPQVPITQVLIVGGFVVLFLIYRFRVTRSMKRRKY